MTGKTVQLIGSLTLMACLAISLAAQRNADLENIGKRDINKNSAHHTPSIGQELTLGEQLSKELESQVRLSADPSVLALVNRVGQLIARNSDAKIPITVRVIDTSVIDTTTLPGGYVYVTLGLIRMADTEAELASAIAHGVARVAARHTAELSGTAAFIGLLQTTSQNPSQNSPAAVIPAVFYKSLRDQVEEADFLGLQYLYKAGYDSGAAVDLLERIEALSPANTKQGSNLFQSHPPLSSRIAKIQNAREKILPARDVNVVTTSEFDEVRRRIMP